MWELYDRDPAEQNKKNLELAVGLPIAAESREVSDRDNTIYINVITMATTNNAQPYFNHGKKKHSTLPLGNLSSED